MLFRPIRYCRRLPTPFFAAHVICLPRHAYAADAFYFAIDYAARRAPDA